jgi:adenylate cyclase
MEIERKFLLRSEHWPTPQSSHRITQGYLFSEAERSLRIRRLDEAYILTFKANAGGISRHEIELPADPVRGRELLQHCQSGMIDKIRHKVLYAGKIWEIDVFAGANAGLLVAEIELEREDETFARPDWIGPEVTGDSRFFNTALARQPFAEWGLSYAGLLARYA